MSRRSQLFSVSAQPVQRAAPADRSRADRSPRPSWTSPPVDQLRPAASADAGPFADSSAHSHSLIPLPPPFLAAHFFSPLSPPRARRFCSLRCSSLSSPSAPVAVRPHRPPAATRSPLERRLRVARNWHTSPPRPSHRARPRAFVSRERSRWGSRTPPPFVAVTSDTHFTRRRRLFRPFTFTFKSQFSPPLSSPAAELRPPWRSAAARRSVPVQRLDALSHTHPPPHFIQISYFAKASSHVDSRAALPRIAVAVAITAATAAAVLLTFEFA